MRTVQTALRYSAIALMGLGVACSGEGASNVSSGNAALGIAKFETQDTATKTSVVGLDAKGGEVGRLDLVHGRFALTDQFKDDYPGQAEVDGRKMDVTLQGKRHFVWETAGYEPVLHMPAHPPSETKLAAFLADPHVKPVLDHWQIGFDPFVAGADGETAYTTGSTAGTSSYNCKTSSPNTQCGTARDGLTINSCGGGYVPFSSYRVTRTSPYNEYFIDQCCPSTSGADGFFGQKSCPTTGLKTQSVQSTCGAAATNSACKACGSYDVMQCNVTGSSSQNNWNYNNGTFQVDSLTPTPLGCDPYWWSSSYIDLTIGDGCQSGVCGSGPPCGAGAHTVHITLPENVTWSVIDRCASETHTGSTYNCTFDATYGWATIKATYASGMTHTFQMLGYY